MNYPPLAVDYLNHYGYMDSSGVCVLCGDNARFMNHSFTPNISAADNLNYALADIACGEEIVCDYSEFDINFTTRFI